MQVKMFFALALSFRAFRVRFLVSYVTTKCVNPYSDRNRFQSFGLTETVPRFASILRERTDKVPEPGEITKWCDLGIHLTRYGYRESVSSHLGRSFQWVQCVVWYVYSKVFAVRCLFHDAGRSGDEIKGVRLLVRFPNECDLQLQRSLFSFSL